MCIVGPGDDVSLHAADGSFWAQVDRLHAGYSFKFIHIVSCVGNRFPTDRRKQLDAELFQGRINEPIIWKKTFNIGAKLGMKCWEKQRFETIL